MYVSPIFVVCKFSDINKRLNDVHISCVAEKNMTYILYKTVRRVRSEAAAENRGGAQNKLSS